MNMTSARSGTSSAGGDPARRGPWAAVGRVVIQNDVDGLVGRQLGLEGVEEADELLMAVTLHVAPDHRASEDVQGGEQRRGAVALVVVGHGRAPTALER